MRTASGTSPIATAIHNKIRSSFSVSILTYYSPSTLLCHPMRCNVFLKHEYCYFFGALTVSIINHSLRNFRRITCAPEILMYTISDIIYLPVVAYHKATCSYPFQGVLQDWYQITARIIFTQMLKLLRIFLIYSIFASSGRYCPISGLFQMLYAHKASAFVKPLNISLEVLISLFSSLRSPICKSLSLLFRILFSCFQFILSSICSIYQQQSQQYLISDWIIGRCLHVHRFNLMRKQCAFKSVFQLCLVHIMI